jgi:hypothetical protein
MKISFERSVLEKLLVMQYEWRVGAAETCRHHQKSLRMLTDPDRFKILAEDTGVNLRALCEQRSDRAHDNMLEKTLGSIELLSEETFYKALRTVCSSTRLFCSARRKLKTGHFSRPTMEQLKIRDTFSQKMLMEIR